MTESKTPTSSPERSSWWNKGIAAYLITSGADAAADGVFYMALAWLAVKYVESSTGAAVVFAAGSIPLIVVTLLGGVLADRIGAGRSATITVSARIVLLLGFTLMCMRPEWITLGSLVAFSIALGFADALHMPAVSALAGLLADESEQGRVQSAVSATNRGATVLATGLGGMLIGWWLPAPGWVMIALLVVSLLALMVVRREPRIIAADTPTDEGGTSWAQLREGLFAVRSDSVIMLVLGLLTVLNFATTPLMSIGVAIKGEEFDWAAAAYGWVFASFPVGSVIGAVAMSRWGERAEGQRLRIGSFLLVPITIGAALTALASQPLWAALGCLIMGMASAPGAAMFIGEVRGRTKPELMGRMMSVVMLSIFAFIPLGEITFGLVSDANGARTAGAVMAAALGLMAVVTLSFQARATSR